VARGFSIIEIVIAMAIGVMMITAVEIAAYGNQSSLTSSALNADVVAQAKVLIEREQALGGQDFNLVNPTSTVGEYTKSVSVTLLPDFVTKLVSARVSLQGNTAVDTTYATLVTNLENVNAPDTCDSTPSGDWTNPQKIDFTLSSLTATTSLFTINDIDAYRGKLYVAVASTTYTTDPALFIIDASAHVLLGTIDSNPTAKGGLAAVRIGEDYLHGKRYAFAARPYTIQFQIFDVTNPTTPTNVKSLQISGSNAGRSIFVRGKYAYLGLESSPGGTEFNVIDITDPTNPSRIRGYQIGNGINAITVKKTHAYVASPNAQNLIVLDVHDPVHQILLEGGFTPPYPPGAGGANHGKQIAVVGSSIFLGRTFGTNEFYALDGSDIAHIHESGSIDIGVGNKTSINGLIVRQNLAFIVSKSGFSTLQIADAAHISMLTTLVLPGEGAAMDCEGNTLYIGSNDASGNGWISIITAGD
jgi:hypothetical protein